MKKLLLVALFAVFSAVAFAQNQVVVKNGTTCNLQYLLYADVPGVCNATYTSAVYSLPPGAVITWTIASISWSGTPPPASAGFIGGAVIESGPFCPNGTSGVKVGQTCFLSSTGVLPTVCSQCSPSPLQVDWPIQAPANKQLNVY